MVGERYNILDNLMQNEEYSDLISFTEQEIKVHYKERLDKIVYDRNLNDSEMFKGILKPYYISYRFTPSGVFVCNPLSVTKYLTNKLEEPPTAVLG